MNLCVLRFTGGVNWGVTVACLPSRIKVSAARATFSGTLAVNAVGADFV